MVHRKLTIVISVDFDIETPSTGHYAALVNQLRSHMNGASKQYYITAAPQCPFPDLNLGSLINSVGFDAIYVQFCVYLSLTASLYAANQDLQTTTTVVPRTTTSPETGTSTSGTPGPRLSPPTRMSRSTSVLLLALALLALATSRSTLSRPSSNRRRTSTLRSVVS